MPGKGLRERYVQDKALTHLEDFYKARFDTKRVVSCQEAVVRSDCKIGRGRADGLVAVSTKDFEGRDEFIASLEAKSQRTIKQLGTEYMDRKLKLHAFAAGTFAGILSLLLAAVLQFGGVVGWVAALAIGVLIAFVWAVVWIDHPRYTRVAVIEQVKGYPANERWIAISSDAYNKYEEEDKAGLRKDCDREGIGLLKVSTKKVEELVLPGVPRNSSHRMKKPLQYLDSYTKANEIRAELTRLRDEQVSVQSRRLVV